MVAPRRGKKTNPQLVQLIGDLRSAARTHQAAIWRDIAERLEGPSRNWAAVNLAEIARHVESNGAAVVPGKVLGAGDVAGPLTIGAVAFSGSAKTKLEKAGGKALTITELIARNPKGTGVRILGSPRPWHDTRLPGHREP